MSADWGNPQTEPSGISRAAADYGFLQRLDARAKIIVFIAAAILAASTPVSRAGAFAWYAKFLVAIWIWGRVSPGWILPRLAAILPFVAAAALMGFWSGGRLGMNPQAGAAGHGALYLFLGLLGKSMIGATSILLLGALTPWAALLAGFERMGVPRTLTASAGLARRFAGVLAEEALRMRRAALSRGWRPAWISDAPAFGRIIGALFLRSYERSDRIYAAMLARGFDGQWPVSRGGLLDDKARSLAPDARGFGWPEAMFVALSLGYLIIIRLYHP